MSLPRDSLTMVHNEHGHHFSKLGCPLWQAAFQLEGGDDTTKAIFSLNTSKMGMPAYSSSWLCLSTMVKMDIAGLRMGLSSYANL